MKKTKKEKKHCLCMFLLFLPVFFFSAYLIMWKRSKNDGYRKMGIFYGISSSVTFVASALGLVWPKLLYVIISHVIVWMLCTIHTLNCRQQYEQLVKWEEEDRKRPELAKDNSFRLRNSCWCFWDYIPLMGGFATYFIGNKLDNAKLKWIGAISTLCAAGLFFYVSALGQVTNPLLTAICLIVTYCAICIHPLIAYFYYEDYMDAAARQWEEDIPNYPQMEDRKWRVSNSLWQVLTLVPSFGSMGLFWAGITREDKTVLLKACGTLVLEMVCLAGPSIITGNEALLQAHPAMAGVARGIGAMGVFVYALVIFTGAMIRQEMLYIRSEQEYEF